MKNWPTFYFALDKRSSSWERIILKVKNRTAMESEKLRKKKQQWAIGGGMVGPFVALHCFAQRI